MINSHKPASLGQSYELIVSVDKLSMPVFTLIIRLIKGFYTAYKTNTGNYIDRAVVQYSTCTVTEPPDQGRNETHYESSSQVAPQRQKRGIKAAHTLVSGDSGIENDDTVMICKGPGCETG